MKKTITIKENAINECACFCHGIQIVAIRMYNVEGYSNSITNKIVYLFYLIFFIFL